MGCKSEISYISNGRFRWCHEEVPSEFGKTADGFNARTVELGKQTGFDKLGDMISNGFSAGANGITKVVDMYASVQDMINYAKQGIDVFKEYDAALTDISYTTEGTKEQISDMGKSYVQLAKDMSTSVEDS